MSVDSGHASDPDSMDSQPDSPRGDSDASKRATPHPKIFAATLDLAKALEQRDAALKARRRGSQPIETNQDFVLPSPVQRSAQLLQLRQTAQAAATAAAKPTGFSGLMMGLRSAPSAGGDVDTGSVRISILSVRPPEAAFSLVNVQPPKSHRAASLEAAEQNSSDSDSDSNSSSSEDDEDDSGNKTDDGDTQQSPRFRPASGWKPASPNLERKQPIATIERPPPMEEKYAVASELGVSVITHGFLGIALTSRFCPLRMR